MAEIIAGQGKGGLLFHDFAGSGLKRHTIQGAMPMVIINPEDISSAALSGIDVNTDDLEALSTSGNVLLQQIADNTDTLEVTVSGIEVNTDTLEALQGSGNASLVTIDASLVSVSGSVDGLETLQTAGNASLASISGAVDGLEALETAGNASLVNIDANTASISGAVDGLETLQTAGNASLASISGAVDGLETLQTATNALLTSISGTNDGVIRDTDGTAVDVTAVSGGFNAAFVQVDAALTTSSVLASGAIAAAAFSADVDISSQLGFYNNALFIGSSVAGDLEIHANSDAGTNFALVTTLTFAAGGDFLYYDLAGYESEIKVKPTVSGDYQIQLVRSR